MARSRSRRKSKKFEACVLGVKRKQSARCKKSNYKDKGCYNPWAVCHASLKRSRRSSRKHKRSKVKKRKRTKK